MNNIKAAIYGFIVGDVLGFPVEFLSRDTLRNNPVAQIQIREDMNVPKGVFSDDTSMTLATMDSIITYDDINLNDIMSKFCEWCYNGVYTSTNKVLDIGITTRQALAKYYLLKLDPVECGANSYNDNGNGSLMRMLPVIIYCKHQNIDFETLYTYIKNTSSLTHSHDISILGCLIYSNYITNLLNGYDKFKSYEMINIQDYTRLFSTEVLNHYEIVFNHKVHSLNENDIKSTGFIVDTLVSSLWCILKSNTFKETLLMAVNLGNDTDTIGAITGSMAGLIYGYSAIPSSWINEICGLNKYEHIISSFINSYGK